MREINLIVIHCTASPNGRPASILDVDAWHRQRGFQRTMEARRKWQPELTSIGYHYLIGLDGSVFPGRSLDEIGAHAKGYNANSVGISMVGTDQFTPAQWTALKMTVDKLSGMFPDAKILGHRDLPDVHKTCPGFDVALWLKSGHAPLVDHEL